MRRARRSSLLALALLATLGARHAPHSPRAPHSAGEEQAARAQIEAAERARAENLAAQRQAADRAAAAAAEANRLAAERVAAAARLHQAERATTEAADRLETLADRRREAEAQLQARAEAMQPLLPLIERLALYPAETLLAVPGKPEDTLRGLIVLRGIAARIGQDALALRRQQDALADATHAEEAEVPKLTAAKAAQAAQATALDRQLASAQASRQEALSAAAADAQRAAAEAARGESLHAVLASLEAQRRAEEARAREEEARAARQKHEAEAVSARQRQRDLAPPSGAGTIAVAAQPRGQLTAPVAGTIVRGWGAATDAGPATGVSYRAAPSARVVSPCAGRAAFAEPFRSYGLLLIIDCGGGYHAVLAGFERLDVKPGQPVQAGEPVGVMPAWDPRSPGSRPSLYVELRRQGQPVNPAPWLKASS